MTNLSIQAILRWPGITSYLASCQDPVRSANPIECLTSLCKGELVERRVAFLDLRIADDAAREELLAAVDAVLRHGRIVLGPEVQELERRVAERCGRKYAVGVNSGTDALFLGLKSLGIGPGDEVITTALSWIATTNAIALTGATP